MKKIVVILSLLVSTLAVAGGQNRHYGGNNQHYNGHNRHYNSYQHNHQQHWNWVLPAVIGGAVVYGVTRPSQPQYVQPPTRQYIQTEYVGSYCGPWIETLHSDGTVSRTRTCSR